MKDYYKEIDSAIKCYETGKYRIHDIDWICSRIDWCWKWRRIGEHQKDELCDRIVAIMKMI